MNEQTLIEQLCGASASALPARADVIALRQLTRDETQARVKRLVGALHEAGNCPTDHATLAERGDRSVTHLPEGARAVVYHASGALQYISGLAPLEAPFEKLEEPALLLRRIATTAERLKITDWAGEQGAIAFERLWQTKGQGADREQRIAAPTLFRAIGAYRHLVAGIPVLGAASVAITLAGDGRLDALSLNVRPVLSETVDNAIIVAPELAARHILERLASLLGRSKEPLPSDLVASATMRFGYLDVGKRKAQRLLAPVFVAQIALRHRLERQAYVIAVPATERHYLELPLFGTEALPTHARGNNCKQQVD